MDQQEREERCRLVHETEKQALTGRNSMAQVCVVSALRKYRHAVNELISARYKDGAVDGATMHKFVDAVAEAEDDLVNFAMDD